MKKVKIPVILVMALVAIAIDGSRTSTGGRYKLTGTIGRQ
jgi:hypothetical protein